VHLKPAQRHCHFPNLNRVLLEGRQGTFPLWELCATKLDQHQQVHRWQTNPVTEKSSQPLFYPKPVFAKMTLMSDLQCMTGAHRNLFGEPARIQSTYGFDVPMDIGD
jgi:hypothetical protein